METCPYFCIFGSTSLKDSSIKTRMETLKYIITFSMVTYVWKTHPLKQGWKPSSYFILSPIFVWKTHPLKQGWKPSSYFILSPIFVWKTHPLKQGWKPIGGFSSNSVRVWKTHPLKQGWKLKCNDTIYLITRIVWKTHPLKQGWKQTGSYQLIYTINGLKDSSIKTRMETYY